MPKTFKITTLAMMVLMLTSCDFFSWDFKQNPYYLLTVMKKAIKGEKVELFQTYFTGGKAICLYANQTGVDFLINKVGDAANSLEISEDLTPGQNEYQFYVTDSRTSQALFDVTVTCFYDVKQFNRTVSYCAFSDIKNLTDNEQYPDLPICLDAN